MSQIQATTALMKNQKAAQALADQSQFQALQTADGCALFLGIGSTDVLFVMREQASTTAGWVPLDMTSGIGALLPGRTVKAKSFAASQDRASGDIVLAQIVNTAEDGQDHLFVATGLSHDPAASWLDVATPPTWTALPYDDSAHPTAALNLGFIKLASYQDTTAVPSLVAGVVQSQTGYIVNYLVNLSPADSEQAWNVYPTNESFDTLYGLEIGRSANASYWGLYELYTLSDETSLTFTPSRTAYGSGSPVTTKLSPPAGASAIATTPADTTGHTNLYVAAGGAIWLFPPAQQNHYGEPVQIISSSLIAGVDTLQVCISDSQAVLWARTGSGTVLCARCPADQQASATSWSTPVPIALNAEQVASMLDLTTQSSTLFVHSSGQTLQKLTQDPVTTLWRELTILLPALSPNDVYETYTHTAHVQLVDSNGLATSQTTLNITASSPVTVYINDVYSRLSDTAPLQVVTTQSGTVTIVQETQDLGGVSYNLIQDDGTTVIVNPAADLLGKLAKVQAGKDLDGTVTDELGVVTSIVPCAVTPAQKDAVATTVSQFVSYANSLPTDGSLAATARLHTAETALRSTPSASFGLSFANNDIQAITDAGDLSGALEALCGDIFHWIKQTAEEVDQFLVQIVDGIGHFFVQIGKDIYHFILACAADVLHGLQYIFSKIGTAFETLVQWLGFIFDWNDILATHAVLRNIFQCYVAYYLGLIGQQKDFFTQLPGSLSTSMDRWAGLPQPADGIGSLTSAYSSPPGQGHPATHWGNHQFSSNNSAATIDYNYIDPGTSSIQEIVDAVTEWFNQQQDIVAETASTFKTQVIEQVGSLSAGEILKRALAIISEALLESLCDGIADIAGLLKYAVASVQGVLIAHIDIPVLSWIYNKFAEAPLTILDLVCLLAAIPVTAVFKIAFDTAPFPDAAQASALQNAADVAALRTIFAASPMTAAIRSRPLAGMEEASFPLVPPTLNSVTDRWNFAANIIVYVSGFVVALCNAIKVMTPENEVAGIVSAVAYVPIAARDYGIGAPQTPIQRMNESLAVVSMAKTFADISLAGPGAEVEDGLVPLWKMLSPVTEVVVDILWMLPAFDPLADNTSSQTIAQAVANCAFNLTGLILLLAGGDPDEVTKAVLVAMAGETTALYGQGMLLSSFLPADN